ncbi:MAG TPA: hypothetical protein VKF15_06550 [Nitrososphaerales archaeon]|nr:hypothetical protein [Nitrososphaerales archaeon]
MPERGSLAVCISAAVAGVLLSVFIHSPWSNPIIYSDIGSFWARSWVQAARVPYVQAFFEYPPLSGFAVYLARVVGVSYDGYYLVFGALSVLAGGALAWSTWRSAKALGTKLNPFFFVIPGMVVYSFYSFDLFHALFIMLSLQFFLEKRRTLSAFSLGLAVATKLVGGFLLPIYLMETKEPRQRWEYLVVFLESAGAVFVPLALINFGNIYGLLPYFRAWGLEDAWYVWIFQDPATWTYAKVFGIVLTGFLLFAVYTAKVPMVQKAFLALSAYLLGTYIYAPQFSLMLIPLAALLSLEGPLLFAWDVSNVLIILTWFTTSEPTQAWTLPQGMALIRSAALAAMCGVLARKASNELRGPKPVGLNQGPPAPITAP